MTPRLAVVPELDEELDRLYGLPLDEFTAVRNELATRLRKAGQADAAERVRTLRKPGVAVWTVNQLARRHPGEIDELVENGRQLRDAQAKALRGTGADAVREATAAERASLRRVTRLAEELLNGEGRPATAAMLERIASTLRAAAVDPDAAALLEAGRLPDEVESSGFAALAAMAPPPSATRRGGAKKREERKPNAAQIRKLETRLAKLEARASDLAERAERAEAVAAEARERAQQAHAEREAAARELRDAKR
ncbi:MAG: hypothetical protein E6G50_09335 [Actinobacteria bacterium]|nr:MAG: hypothetical protein E6G50_09335 [Actinomycetota bacterium]